MAPSFTDWMETQAVRDLMNRNGPKTLHDFIERQKIL